jgi:hypothetical protein
MKSLILLVMTQMVTCEIPRSKAISVSLLRLDNTGGIRSTCHDFPFPKVISFLDLSKSELISQVGINQLYYTYAT